MKLIFTSLLRLLAKMILIYIQPVFAHAPSRSTDSLVGHPPRSGSACGNVIHQLSHANADRIIKTCTRKGEYNVKKLLLQAWPQVNGWQSNRPNRGGIGLVPTRWLLPRPTDLTLGHSLEQIGSRGLAAPIPPLGRSVFFSFHNAMGNYES